MIRPPLLLAGYGRFGAFAAGFLKRRFTVYVLEPRYRVPLQRGLKRASTGDIGRFELLLLAMPAAALEKFLMSHAARIGRGAFVADVCAVKTAPMAWMRRMLRPDVSFAGLHPLFGPASASGGLRGHRVAVCRGRSTDRCHRRLLSTIRDFGLEPVETDPVIHDKTMASTLFLTEFIGRILRDNPAAETLPFTTPSFRHLELIRAVASGNPPGLIRELVRYNPFCPRVLGKTKNRLLGEIGRLEELSGQH